MDTFPTGPRAVQYVVTEALTVLWSPNVGIKHISQLDLF